MDAYKNTRTSHAAPDSAVRGHAGHTWPGGPKEPVAQQDKNEMVDYHPELNEDLHRGQWTGNTLNAGATATTYETNQENLTRGGLQVGKPVIGLSTTPLRGQTTHGAPLPNTGMQQGTQMAGQHRLPTDLKSDIQSHGRLGMESNSLGTTSTLGSMAACGHSGCTTSCTTTTTTTSIPLSTGGLSGSLADAGLGKSSTYGSTFNKLDNVQQVTNEDMLRGQRTCGREC